ncbi:SDR family NAD(P)-dependent oxidoreductase [Rhodococcus erythropolis]|uniref:SDR family NAD(P)-dependent oxidoreductase n=1 Tax=Rhodococcus erythropolis TaxID=1833 RepID=UPI000AFC2B69|nr:SDR family NAD(P)-dependent oxidoreductase [Rhodococcus erythropolis]
MVTAAASGIGLACVQRFLDEGATVLASDKDLAGLEQSLATHPDRDRLRLGQLDVSSYEAVKEYVEGVSAEWDALDVLVNNAGIGSWGAVDKLEVERWHTVIAVTLDSVFYTCKETMPLLKRAQGAIVNTSSISGMFGDNGFAAYNAAKAGVINLTRTLAIDHAVDGVRANVVCPGLTDTPRVTWMQQTDEISSEYDRRLPTKRAGRPEEMASAIAFLASDDSTYITGVTLPVDGGLTAATGQPAFLQLLPNRV